MKLAVGFFLENEFWFLQNNWTFLVPLCSFIDRIRVQTVIAECTKCRFLHRLLEYMYGKNMTWLKIRQTGSFLWHIYWSTVRYLHTLIPVSWIWNVDISNKNDFVAESEGYKWLQYKSLKTCQNTEGKKLHNPLTLTVHVLCNTHIRKSFINQQRDYFIV